MLWPDFTRKVTEYGLVLRTQIVDSPIRYSVQIGLKHSIFKKMILTPLLKHIAFWNT